MNINIKEKFNLIEKIEKLIESLGDHGESKALCQRGLHEFKKGVNPGAITSFVNTLNGFSWITEVNNFVEDYNKFVTENQYGLTLEAILNNLESSNHKATYSSAIETIKVIVPLSEEEIKTNMHKLSGYKYVPALRIMVEKYEREEFAVTRTGKAEVKRNHISPIMVTEGGYVFELNGKNYEVDPKMTKIEEYKGPLSKEYSFGLTALKLFKVNEAGEFVMAGKNDFIKISASEEGTKFFIGEQEFTSRESAIAGLKSTRNVDYLDKTTQSLVGYMYENVGNFTNIEIVKDVKTVDENTAFSFVKLSNNKLLLNRVNKLERVNEMIEITGENFDSIVESFKKNLNLDIVPVLENIKANIKAIEFAKMVRELNIADVVEKEEELKAKIEEAANYYEGLNEGEKADSVEALKDFETKKAILENKKVIFLLETRSKYKDEEVDGIEEVLEMLNGEIKEAIA